MLSREFENVCSLRFVSVAFMISSNILVQLFQRSNLRW